MKPPYPLCDCNKDERILRFKRNMRIILTCIYSLLAVLLVATAIVISIIFPASANDDTQKHCVIADGLTDKFENHLKNEFYDNCFGTTNFTIEAFQRLHSTCTKLKNETMWLKNITKEDPLYQDVASILPNLATSFDKLKTYLDTQETLYQFKNCFNEQSKIYQTYIEFKLENTIFIFRVTIGVIAVLGVITFLWMPQLSRPSEFCWVKYILVLISILVSAFPIVVSQVCINRLQKTIENFQIYNYHNVLGAC